MPRSRRPRCLLGAPWPALWILVGLCAAGARAQEAALRSRLDIAAFGCAKPVYPERALAERAQGTTVAIFTIDAEARLARAEIAQSSGASREHRLLDRAAVDWALRCDFSGLPGAGAARRFRVDFVWVLGLPPAATAAP